MRDCNIRERRVWRQAKLDFTQNADEATDVITLASRHS